jgi:hypothetical protein
MFFAPLLRIVVLAIFMSDSGSPVIWRFRRPSVAVQLPAPIPVKRPSRRQQLLKNKFLALQAVEADSNDESVSGSDNSDDDDDEPDLSCMTDASVSVDDDDMAVYRASLSSQAGALGFGTPIADTRRGRFRSTFDLARTPFFDFAGTVCPNNHMCRIRIYRCGTHSCDLCVKNIV